MGCGIWIAIFMENIFIKTLNKNLRSLAGSALSAGDFYLKIRVPADYADSGDLRRMGFGFGLQFSWKIYL